MQNHKKTFPKLTLTTLLYLMISFFSVELLHAEIYVWTDENGNKVFGDEPKKSDQAKPVELEPLTVLQFPKGTGNVVDSTPSTTNPYTAFAIISPTEDETIRDNAGSLSVSLSIEPSLVEGHKIQLYIDGSPYQSAQASLSFNLANLDRGTHSVSASVIDESGKNLTQTQSISFHLHRFIKTK